MRALAAFLAMNITGYLGWWLGSFIGIGTALALSIIASGFGYYYGRKLYDYYF